MNLKTGSQDNERAVSPVIGVILMVAITVILAAVIGTFVLGLGDQLSDTAPTASIDSDTIDNSGTNDQIEFTHSGGDTIDGDNLRFVSSNSAVTFPNNNKPTEFATGNTATTEVSGSSTGGDTTTVSLVYDDGSTSSTLASIEVDVDETGEIV